jgi:hypothetical protein
MADSPNAAAAQRDKRAAEAEQAGVPELMLGDFVDDPTAVYDPVGDYPERPLEEALSEPRKVELIALGVATGGIVEFTPNPGVTVPDKATPVDKARLVMTGQARGRAGADFKVTGAV